MCQLKMWIGNGDREGLNVAVHCLACPCLRVQLPGPVNSEQPVHGFIHQSSGGQLQCAHTLYLFDNNNKNSRVTWSQGEGGGLGIERPKKKEKCKQGNETKERDVP